MHVHSIMHYITYYAYEMHYIAYYAYVLCITLHIMHMYYALHYILCICIMHFSKEVEIGHAVVPGFGFSVHLQAHDLDLEKKMKRSIGIGIGRRGSLINLFTGDQNTKIEFPAKNEKEGWFNVW